MTTYILKMEDSKYLNRLVVNNIKFLKIKYLSNSCLLYVDKNNYNKLLKYFDLYEISLIKVEGLEKYRFLFKKYFIFFISMLVGIAFLYLLSHIIFDIKIMTDKHDLVKILENELDYYGIAKYHFVKSFEEKEKIKKKILEDHKDKFEWLEFDLVGGKYYIKVLERVINNIKDNNVLQDVVAKKNAVIVEIKAESGQIVKKVNDYVNKGDTIISGNITKKDEIKNTVMAQGIVYGETWYNVKVELPHSFSKKIYTGNSYKRITMNVFNNKIYLFGKKNYLYEEDIDKPILSSFILPFSLNKTEVKELKIVNSIYTYDEALNKGLDIAREKLLSNLASDSKILSQRKLKLYEENNKIIIEVFFKVYENITDYKEIDNQIEIKN